jgi:curved DNA-binding protein CbpA
VAPRSALSLYACRAFLDWVAADDVHAAEHSSVRLALADKNQHRLAEADDKFKEISNAYEVLSDQHEREW